MPKSKKAQGKERNSKRTFYLFKKAYELSKLSSTKIHVLIEGEEQCQIFKSTEEQDWHPLNITVGLN